jgi:hypothetical protein
MSVVIAIIIGVEVPFFECNNYKTTSFSLHPESGLKANEYDTFYKVGGEM